MDHFTGGQFLIAGGFVDGASDEITEVVELVNTSTTPSFGQLPSERVFAVGAMFGNAPLLCGGEEKQSKLDTCISYQDSQWSQSYSMIQKRSRTAGVQVNSSTFWILGGYDDSTEFIIQGHTKGVPGPKLPFPDLLDMCVVKLSESEIFVIGGRTVSSARNEVWIYDPQNGFVRNQGPYLHIRRFAHSCSTMRDGQKTKIIAAGGIRGSVNSENFLKFIEIYDPTDNTWHSGKKYPN